MAGYQAITVGELGAAFALAINTMTTELFGENAKAFITVADATALAAIPAEYLSDGKRAIVLDVAKLYRYDLGTTAWVEDTTLNLKVAALKIGTTAGILKGTAGVVSAATAKVDYAPATSGVAVLKGDGSGGFAAAAEGSDYAPATAGVAILKGDGAGSFADAVAGVDYAAPTSGSAILKGDGSGGFASAAAGTDYCAAPSGSAIQKANGSGALTAATARTDYVVPPTVTTLTSAGTLNATHDIVLANKATPFTIGLPAAASSSGKVYQIKNIGVGLVTIDPNGAETIDGETTLVINQYTAVTVVSNGSAWFIL